MPNDSLAELWMFPRCEPCSDGATCSRSFLRFDHEKRHHDKQQECGDQFIFERHRAYPSRKHSWARRCAAPALAGCAHAVSGHVAAVHIGSFLRRGNPDPRMSLVGLGCAKTPALAPHAEISLINCISESQNILRTRGSMPCWRIVFSTFRECMSFYTARVRLGHSAMSASMSGLPKSGHGRAIYEYTLLDSAYRRACRGRGARTGTTNCNDSARKARLTSQFD